VPDRVLLYGVTGSGKSTLAVDLGKRTALPVHLVDELTWERGWVAVDPDIQRLRIEEICSGERWVLDTAYSQWIEVVFARAETVVALDCRIEQRSWSNAPRRGDSFPAVGGTRRAGNVTHYGTRLRLPNRLIRVVLARVVGDADGAARQRRRTTRIVATHSLAALADAA
jgi:adenylate kinase family enzyme